MTGTANFAPVGDLQICYDEFGNPNDPAVLLIMGIGAQMVFWRADFCQQLADHGYRVIRFDNRDCGLSTKLDGVAPGGGSQLSNLARYYMGIATPGTAYTLVDMAADGVGVLDHLGIDKAHIVGASMGGMIAQVFAAEHADRTLTATIIMSSNNQGFLPPPGAKQLLALIKRPPANATREAMIDRGLRTIATIGSRTYFADPQVAREQAAEYYDRSFYPVGFTRQFAAIMGTGRLVPYDKRITAPTLVMHGTDDRLMRAAGSRAIAQSIDDAHLVFIKGMGHDLPKPLWPKIIGELRTNFGRA